MAKKRTATRGKSAKRPSIVTRIGRVLAALWRFIARAIGSTVRFLFKEARELDSAHHRDGFAFLLLIFALLSAAGSWFHLHNPIGRFMNTILLGSFGKVAIVTPILLSTLPLGYLKHLIKVVQMVASRLALSCWSSVVPA
jgi:S-DNA-T family DNA segregation ATPase FtsK/SpoIIIE